LECRAARHRQAEITNGEKNPRFIVTDIVRDANWIQTHACLADGRGLYEDAYCAARGMEKPDQRAATDMFADRTSTAFMSSNQLRLVVLHLRLPAHESAAQCGPGGDPPGPGHRGHHPAATS